MPVETPARRIPAYSLYGESPRRAHPPLHVETIEARSAGHHWKIDPHRHHDLHQLVMVLGGHGVVVADGQRSQRRPPFVAVMPAGTVHGFEFEPGTRGYVISLARDLLSEMVARDEALRALFAYSSIIDAHAATRRLRESAHCAHRLAREFSRSPNRSNASTQGWLLVLLGGLLHGPRAGSRENGTSRNHQTQLVARFSEVVERRFRTQPSLAQLAAALRVPESRLRHACLAVTGQTPIQLLHARVMLEAKRQLHYTDSGVREVAFGLGFGDAAYFSRFFTTRSGMSPRRFRQQGAAAAAATARTAPTP